MINSIMKNSLLIPLIAVGLLFVGCKTTKVGGTADCPKRDANELVEELKKKSASNFNFFYAKMSCKVITGESSQSFKTSLKMKPDSAIGGVLKVMGIVGAAYMADTDTVQFTNKLKKCYFKKDYQIMTQQFGLELDYKLLEDMILGKPFGLSSLEALYPIKNDSMYVLASHDKKMMQKLADNNLSDIESEDKYIQYKLDCGTLQLAQIEINAPSLLTHITINYTERQEVEKIDFPKLTNIQIENPKDTTSIILSYDDIRLNNPKTIKINIPDSYSECK